MLKLVEFWEPDVHTSSFLTLDNRRPCVSEPAQEGASRSIQKGVHAAVPIECCWSQRDVGTSHLILLIQASRLAAEGLVGVAVAQHSAAVVEVYVRCFSMMSAHAAMF